MRPYGAVQVTRKRYGMFTTSNYEQTRGAPSDSTIWASVQPMSRAERQWVLEVHGAEAEYKAYTSDVVRSLNEELRLPADEIVWNSGIYRVVAVEPHVDAPGLAHRKFYLRHLSDQSVSFSSGFSSGFEVG